MASAELAVRAVAAPHVRIPKLAYRNQLPADQTSLLSRQTSFSDIKSVDSVLVQRLPTPTSSAESSLRDCPSSDTLSVASSSLASSDASSSSRNSMATKKKKAGFFSFITLKEPSQSALEQFAQQQRKQAAEQGLKRSPSRLGTATQPKLPATVPRVDSKWDGLPEAVKTRRASLPKPKSIRTGHANSKSWSFTNASTFSVASDASRNPPNSLVSASGSTWNFPRDSSNLSSASSGANERRDSGSSLASRQGEVQSHERRPSTTSLAESTYLLPDSSSSSETLSLPSHGDVSANPSSLAPAVTTNPSQATSSAACMDEAAIIALTTPPALKRAPDVDMDVDADAEAIFRRLQVLGLSEDDYDMQDDSHDFLFKTNEPPSHPRPMSMPIGDGMPSPPAMNFSRPFPARHVQQAPVESSRPSTAIKSDGLALPTVYEASVASTKDADDSVTISSDGAKGTSIDSDSISIAPSVTPSEMSASWYQSPRERLGLGGRIRKADVSPWEQEFEPRKRRLSTLSSFSNVFVKGST